MSIMRKKLLPVFLALAMVVSLLPSVTLTASAAGTAAYGTNLVINGSAEACDTAMAGWSASGSVFTVLTPSSGYSEPASADGGNVFDYYPQANGTEYIYQTIDISNLATDIAAGLVCVNVSAYARKYMAVAEDTVKLEVLDSSDDVLNTYSKSGTTGDNNDTWETLTISQNSISTSASKLRITLTATISDASLDCDYIEFDGISLVLTKTPTVTTTSVSTYAATTATLGGNVTADGGASVTGRGVVYSSTDATPTIGETGVAQDTNGTGMGTFSESVTGLSSGTTYYARAYATNSAGTSYGNVVTFTPSAAAPTVTTVSPTSGTTAGGTSVTIAGTNLTDATGVNFGSTAAASYRVDSAAQITATSPAHAAGTVDITVTTAGGTSATSSVDGFTYTAPADMTAPSLTAGAASRTSDTAATVKFTSDEAGVYYYGVAAIGAAVPTIDTNGAGTSCTTSETTITLDSASLSAGAKAVYIKVKDAVGNVSDALKIVLFSAGDGTSAAPYEISTEDELDAVRYYPGCNFKQISDITIDTTKYTSWSPIGTAASPFTGSYNGNGYKISDLKINTTADSGADTVLGLFGAVGNGAALSNIKLENVDIDVASSSNTTDESFIGGLAGVNYGTISDCSVTGTIDAASQNIKIGALVGQNGSSGTTDDGDISGCTGNCAINVTVNYQQGHIGGLVGSSFSTGSSITNCSSSGTVTGMGGSTVNNTGVFSGGLVGYASDTTITNCSSNCTVIARDARSQAHAGGLIGGIAYSCSISNCHSSGNATASDAAGSTATKICAGGLIAYSSLSTSTITNSYSTGNAAATGTGSSASTSTYAYVYAGGFLGYISSVSSVVGMTQCYATGSATATVNTCGYAFAGGFGGYYMYANIAKSYSTGSAQAVSAAGYASAGGFTGYLYGKNAATSPSTATNCYSTGNAGASCADNERAGGFSGVTQNSTASYCYSAGIPSVAHTAYALKCGGFTGANTAGTINGCYYDGTISGKTDTDRGTPMSTSDMKISSFITTLANAGATWKLVSNLNSGYPVIDGVGLGALLTCVVTYKDGADTSTTYGTDTVAQGIVFSLPSTISPTKSGNTLSGWYTDSSCGSTDKWNFATQTASAETLALFAGWQMASATKLPTPGALAWDTTTLGKATWGAVTNASSYTVQLYKGGVANGSAVTGITNNYYDFTSAITETGSYTFTVTAVGDGTTCSSSDVSSPSGAYSYTATHTATVNTTIDGAVADVTSVVLKSAGLTFAAAKTSRGVYMVSVPDGTYNVYIGGAYAGNSITISGAVNSVTVDYYTVTFDAKGGSAVASQIVLSGGKAAVPAAPTLSGFDFKGWTDTGYGTAWRFSTDTINAATTLHANWATAAATTYKVTYDGNGATSGSVPVDGTAYDDVNKTVTVKGNTGSLSIAGNTFAGWSDGTTIHTAGQTFTITGNVTLTAQWTPVATTYTATYNNNCTGGGTYTTQGTISSGATLTAPAAPTRTGYTFIGWYKEAACINPWNFSVDTITANTMLYAKWSENTYSVSGTVQDGGTPVAAVSGATVRVMQGNVLFGETVTAADGTFTVTGVPNGTYNLVITKDDQEVTSCITVSGDICPAGTITLPTGNRNSTLEVNGSGTPNVVVDKLNDVFGDTNVYTGGDSTTVASGGTVEIKLTVQENDASTNRSQVEATMTSGGYTSGMVLDVDLTKTVTTSSGEVTNESEVPAVNTLIVLTIPLPVELQGKDSYVVTRAHDYNDGKGLVVDTISMSTDLTKERIEVSADKTQLTLYVKYFSTYAIGYAATSSGGTGGGGSSSSYYSITTTAGTGGSISPTSASVVRGGNKTFTITAHDGYVISDVLVDGKSIGAVGSYTFSNVRAAHSIKAVFAKEATGWTNPYTDVGESDWFYDAVKYVSEAGLMNGTNKTAFGPGFSTTRGMIVTILWRLENKPDYADLSSFSDVPTDEYYTEGVAWAAANGIVLGYDANTYGPDDTITREQLAAILYRYAEYKGYDVAVTNDLPAFTDSADISAYALPAMKWAVTKGIVSGMPDTMLSPNGKATRAQVAVILTRFIKNVVG